MIDLLQIFHMLIVKLKKEHIYWHLLVKYVAESQLLYIKQVIACKSVEVKLFY